MYTSLKKNEERLWIAGTHRADVKLDSVWAHPASSCSIRASALAPATQHKTLVLWGNEPTLCVDLPQQISKWHQCGYRVVLRTDGRSLHQPAVLTTLQQKGLKGLRLVVPSVQPRHYSWIMGGKGGLRKVLRCIQQAKKQALDVEVEIPLFRSNLAELVSMLSTLSALGIRRLFLRRLLARGPAAEHFAMLSSRLEQCAPHVRELLSLSLQQGVQVYIEGIPQCLLRQWSDHIIIPHWLGMDEAGEQESCTQGCVWPSDYMSCFHHATLSCLELPKRESYQLLIKREVSTRVLRKAMVELAQKNPHRLEVGGDFSHPHIYELLRDVLRLSIAQVWLVGDIRPLADLSHAQLFRLRDFRCRVSVLGQSVEAHEVQGGDYGADLKLFSHFTSVELYYLDMTFSKDFQVLSER